MKQYLLSVYQPTGGSITPDELEKIAADLDAVKQEIKAAGAWVFAGGLEAPSTATVLRADGDGVLMTDGPFAEGKEHLGGLSIIAAPDLDGALGWAKKLAGAIGLPIEVRPFAEEH
jgi:hypothetical protein